jgi:hypothetical protein
MSSSSPGCRFPTTKAAPVSAHHSMPTLRTSADYDAYIRARTAMWKGSRNR